MSLFTKIRDAVKKFIVKEAKIVAVFMKPTIEALAPQLKQFAKEDLAQVITHASQCLLDGKGEACAIEAAVSTIQAIAKKQGQELAKTAATSIAANLVQKAKDELAAAPVSK